MTSVATVAVAEVTDTPDGTAERSAGLPPWRWAAWVVTGVVAGFVYGWRAGNYLEIYYAASVRSMSASWHDFVFGAFDPAGTMSVDKLPAALWLQALSVRAFGLHPVAFVLPQVAESVLAVLVVGRVVRRTTEPLTTPSLATVTGLGAAWILIASPASTALDRGNIPDSLMILLLALAANSTVSAVSTGRLRHMLAVGAFVGLAFEAKTLEAWLILPAVLLAAVIAVPRSLRARLLGIGGMLVVTAAVSFAWMAFVQLTPASQRPYVDGSTDNFVFQQAFVYNGFGRLDEESPDQLVTRTIGIDLGQPGHHALELNRLLTGSLGLDTGWLLPAAAIGLVAGLVARRRERREDVVRAGLIVWGGWLLALFGAFTLSSTVNAYYTAALSPPVAASVATGGLLVWINRGRLAARLVGAAAVLATAGYAEWLLPTAGTGLPGWLRPTVIVLGVVGAVGIVVVGRVQLGAVGPALLACAFVVGGAAVVAAPAVASASVVQDRLGPFDTPFQPAVVTAYLQEFFVATPIATAKTIPTIEAARHGAPYLMATETSVLAATFIEKTGLETLPIGGFTGTIPSPTLAGLKTMIERGEFHLVIQSPKPTDARFRWIASHCISLGSKPSAGPLPGPAFALYYCLPASVHSAG